MKIISLLLNIKNKHYLLLFTSTFNFSDDCSVTYEAELVSLQPDIVIAYLHVVHSSGDRNRIFCNCKLDKMP